MKIYSCFWVDFSLKISGTVAVIMKFENELLV